MATYYPNSSNERDLYPAIYQRILGQESYTDSSFPNNMMYLNYPSSGTFPDPSAECSRGQHNLELPMASNLLSQESSACASEMVSSYDGNSFINAFREGKSLMIPSVNAPAAPGADHQMDCHNMAFPASNVHGLSLSLGRHHQIQLFHYHASNADISYLGSRHSPARSGLHSRERTVYYEPDSPFPVLNSKYLKAAQELLDEVVNVRGALIQKREKVHSGGAQKDNDVNFKSNKMHLSAGGSAPNSVSDLSLAERQEIQSKMTKLLNMLDEVDRRYKHYYHQMQGIVAPFDRIAGPDTAKPYTRLALETISRHFRSLRDAIDGQIRNMSMNHGDLEHPCNGDRGNGGIERLRFVDQKLRQERSFQQHAWRLQRGLPESSVSILRAWLFEHFLHPYPKDSDKMLLARQTGLTRNQVSNWFINARVRLWKPMVEEMYKEELGGGGGGGSNDGDVDSNSDDDGGGKSPSLNSPMEVLLPPYEMSRSPDELAVAAIRQAIISADGGSGGVSLTLGLHQGDRRRSAAGDVVARVNGGSGGYDVSNIEPCMDYEGLHLPGKQRKIGSSLLRDFAV